MYKVYNSHGAPQCGCEELLFDSWYEMADYVESLVTSLANDIMNDEPNADYSDVYEECSEYISSMIVIVEC